MQRDRPEKATKMVADSGKAKTRDSNKEESEAGRSEASGGRR